MPTGKPLNASRDPCQQRLLRVEKRPCRHADTWFRTRNTRLETALVQIRVCTRVFSCPDADLTRTKVQVRRSKIVVVEVAGIEPAAPPTCAGPVQRHY